MGEIFKPHIKVNEEFYYGLGWFISKKKIGNNEYDAIWHSGSINGFGSYNYIIPQKGYIIIALHNNGSMGSTFWIEMAGNIIDILNGKEIIMPLPSVAKELSIIMEKEGIKVATEKFKIMKGQDHLFQLKEGEMNDMGYFMLNNKKFNEAIAILSLNVEAFPNSANAFDSLAEAYMLAGNKDLAIKNYEKSLELNPQNTNAVEQLKKLKGTH